MAWGRCGTESDSLQLLSPLQSKKPCSIEQGFLGCNSLTITYFHTGTRTIIDVESFHGPVRDGKGWDQLAMVIRHDLLPHRVWGLHSQFGKKNGGCGVSLAWFIVMSAQQDKHRSLH